MGLYKRGRVWWMCFTYGGRQYRRSCETRDRRLAEKIYHKVMTELIEGRYFERLPGERKTFRELMERYLKEHSLVTKTPKSSLRDKSLAHHLTRFFGNLTLSQIQPRLIADYKRLRREEGAAPKTINNELVLMNHAFNLAMKEWEWVKDNPVSRVRRERVHNFRDRWLRPEEEERLLAASPPWLQDIIICALNTGMRQGELLNLKWQDVDFLRKTIYIHEQKNKGKDIIPLNEDAFEILERRSRVRPIRCEYVFHSKRGTRMDPRNLLRAFYDSLKRAEIENFRFHDLRHTFATRLVHAGVDIYTVQRLMRWKTISMAMRYAHHYPESLRPGVERIARYRERFITILSQSAEKGATT